jgi:hypothetical protein
MTLRCQDASVSGADTLDCSESFRHSVRMASDDWNRLASFVIARRVKLGYRDRKAFAAASGVTARTLGKLETGRQVGAVTLADVELALGWEPYSARRILAGGDPVMREAPALRPQLPEMSDDERREVLSYLAVKRAAERGA